MNLKFFFIVGVGRSGTSLLQSMLAAHPDLVCLPETAYLRRMVSSGKLQFIYEKQGREALVAQLERDEYFQRTKLNPVSIIDKAISRGGFLDAGVYMEMLRSFKNTTTGWVGDKDPRAVEYLSILKVICPNVHVIHIYRDPRDVLSSKKKAAWSKNGHVWKHIFACRVQLKLGCKHGHELNGNRYHEICYEALLVDPEKELQMLCNNLGVNFDERMLQFSEAAKKLVTKREFDWKKETLGPLLKNNKNKWKSLLHPREVKLTELCCIEAMALGGYRTDERMHILSIWDRIWILSGRFIIVLATRPYLFYRNFCLWRSCRRIR